MDEVRFTGPAGPRTGSAGAQVGRKPRPLIVGRAGSSLKWWSTPSFPLNLGPYLGNPETGIGGGTPQSAQP